jgi:hypothetical protein
MSASGRLATVVSSVVDIGMVVAFGGMENLAAQTPPAGYIEQGGPRRRDTANLASPAERSGVGRPLTHAARDHVAYDGADILLLRWLVIRARIVASDGQGPASFARSQFFQKISGVTHVPGGIEHFVHRVEVRCMPVVIDLHAAYIDQLRAPGALGFEFGERFTQARGGDCPSVDIHVEGIERSFASRLGESDRVKNIQWDIVSLRGPNHFSFAGLAVRGDRRA